jgi:Na+/proline symporter
MSTYDYIVIGVYLVFMLSLGPIYKSFSKTASDFFRGGGGMLWWVVGSSAFMNTFSAWSFTGGAAKAYETGTFFLVLFFCNIVSLVVCLIFTAHRFRQMRIVTAVESVRKRFGATSEQIFTWLPLFFQGLFGGISLYTVSVFMSGVFGFEMKTIIFALGVVMIVMTLVGGSWAATNGDFVQMLVVLTITVIMAGLTLAHPQIGGVSGLFEKIPSCHTDWSEFCRPSIIVFFVVMLMVNQTAAANSMLAGASRYVFVKDGRDARKAVLISIVGFLVLSPIWMIPALGSSVLFPNLADTYSNLNNPNEAAYVAIAVELLPKGLLGLLVCGIFAASLTTMNGMLNTYSGMFVRNFYIQHVNRSASETRQIMMGRIFILIYGIIWVLVALYFSQFKGLKLFDLILLAAASIGLPSAIPLAYGMFVKKTPQWAGWSTMVAGFITSVIAWVLTHKVPGFVDGFFSDGAPLNTREIGDFGIAFTTALIFIVCTAWFFLTMLFYKTTDKEYVERVDKFFVEMNTPIDRTTEHEPDYEGDARQHGVLSSLCLTYGGLTMLLLAVPNDLKARLLIGGCASVILLVGFTIRAAGKRVIKKNCPK